MTESVGTELVKRAAKAGMVRDMAVFEQFFRPETDVVARQSEFNLADVFERERSFWTTSNSSSVSSTTSSSTAPKRPSSPRQRTVYSTR